MILETRKGFFDKLGMTVWMSSAFALCACSSAVTPEKISRIHPSMKPDEVKTVLGKPVRIDHAETTGLSGDVYHYPASNGEGRVIFLNDAVFKAEFIPGGKS
jgi:hypothetical protein